MSDETPSLSTGLFKGLTPEDANGILQAGERMSSRVGGQTLEQAGGAGWGLVAHRFLRWAKWRWRVPDLGQGMPVSSPGP